jgi:hypothetical protein
MNNTLMVLMMIAVAAAGIALVRRLKLRDSRGHQRRFGGGGH